MSVATPQLAAIGVVVPAHDEAERLPACLRALQRAVSHPGVSGTVVRVVVVLDACRDRSAEVVTAEALRWPSAADDAPHLPAGPVLRTLVTTANSVGAARAAGCAALIGEFAHLRPEAAWLASTDADSAVPGNWLAHQIGLHARGVQAWAGTIMIDDTGEHPAEGLQHFRTVYMREASAPSP